MGSQASANRSWTKEIAGYVWTYEAIAMTKPTKPRVWEISDSGMFDEIEGPYVGRPIKVIALEDARELVQVIEFYANGKNLVGPSMTVNNMPFPSVPLGYTSRAQDVLTRFRELLEDKGDR